MGKGFLLPSVRSFRRLVVILLMLTTTFVLAVIFGMGRGHLPMPRGWRSVWVGLYPAATQETDSFGAVPWSDLQEVWSWYQGSACSGREKEVVGDQPFFPPCAPGLPPGVASWGHFPYVEPHTQFLNSSKNPCWRHQGHVLCVPYFFLIGVSKSGTSDLFFRLTSHPHVISTSKELHFFDRRRYDKNRSFEDYTSRFKRVAATVEKNIKERGYSHVICGEGSPSYFYDNYNWKLYSGNENCTEPRVILAHHLFHLNPRLKIVMIIRHPVHRLYSRYLFDFGRKRRNHPPSPEEFHHFVVLSLRRYKDCFQRWSIRHCLYNSTLMKSLPELRIQENVYPVLMEDWLRVVPRDQFLFLRFEDYREDMGTQLRKVYSFLGLDSLSDEQLRRLTTSNVRNKGKLVTKTAPMLPETERVLQEFYQPFIWRFAAMLNDKRFLWTDLTSRKNNRTAR
ncbi:carbohydrate sulfotransferase 15-like [Babylonia areolata]|uniref:carbohydrate sulfotransferase 15-like n=1 Tax=Babylonia areolata TaxID=304850 RepID=UPI003FD30807